MLVATKQVTGYLCYPALVYGKKDGRKKGGKGGEGKEGAQSVIYHVMVITDLYKVSGCDRQYL